MGTQISARNTKLERAYEKPAVKDGTHILIDRLWSRGLTKGISFLVSPIRDHTFLSRRSSSACSATTTLNSWASRRRSLTSLLVAARAVSPARRRLPASRNSLDQA